jgi:replicative DNA helicase
MDKFSEAFERGVEDERDLIIGVIDVRATDTDISGHVMSLDPEYFMGRTYRLIWTGFQDIIKNGGFIDSCVVGKSMLSHGASDWEVSAMKELFSIGRDNYGPLDLAPRVQRVANLFKRRLLSRSMEILAKKAITDDISEVEAEFTLVAEKMSNAGTAQTRCNTDYADQFEAYLSGQPILPLEARENLITTGIYGLDKSIVANPGRLIVIGGLPSAGKTAMAVQIIAETAKHGRRVAMASLEMDADEIAARLVACACSVNSLIALRTGSELVDKDSRYHLGVIRKNIVGIHGCAGDTWTSIEAAIVREHNKKPLSVAIIDYLQLLGAPDTKKKNFDNEAQMIGEITKSAKRLAQKLHINVLLLSQFNRKIEEGEEPTLQHFLGSGQIERDADIALLLWNTDGKGSEHAAIRPVACRIAKNRGGERFGKVMLDFNPATNQFTQGKERETSSSPTPAYPTNKKGAEAPIPAWKR